MHLSTLLVLPLLQLAASTAWSAEAGTVYGQSERYSVIISADDYPYQNATITVREIDVEGREYAKEVSAVSFSSQCHAAKRSIVCRSGGTTPLAGTTYRVTTDDSPSCPGTSVGDRYTCVKGCTKDSPRFLTIHPYEC